jgi:hypothetical protein
MKNLMLAVAFIFGATLFSTDAAAQSNDNWFIAQARVAASACTADVNGPITGQVEVVSTCFVSGSITNVHLYRKPTGPNADLVRVRLLATVQFGCDNSIISVQCH